MAVDNYTTGTDYEHPIPYTVYRLPTHTYCSISFSLLITNMAWVGGREISHGVGQGHILRSRNLRCWKQRILMPHRIVRSLIHSS